MANLRVLVIDDDQEALASLGLYLSAVAEFEVTECNNGPDALHILETTHQDYTAIVMDFVLTPAMTGEQVLEQIHTRYPRLPVVVFTGRDPTGGLQALEKGAYYYMRRPVDRVEMVNLVRSLAEQDMPLYGLAREIRTMLESDACLIWRLERRSQQLRVAAWDSNTVLDEKYRQATFIDLTDSITNQFLADGKPVYVRGIRESSPTPHLPHLERALEHDWNSLISVPVLRQGHVIGLIENYSNQCHDLTKEDQEQRLRFTLPLVAAQAREMIRGAELASQLQGLQSIVRVLAGTFDDHRVLEQVLSKATGLVGADSGWISILDTNSGELVPECYVGVTRGSLANHLKLSGEITIKVVKTGETQRANNMFQGQHPKAAAAAMMRSVLAVPLRREEQIIGVLAVASRVANAFSDDDINLLVTLATHAATIVSNGKTLGICKRSRTWLCQETARPLLAMWLKQFGT